MMDGAAFAAGIAQDMSAPPAPPLLALLAGVRARGIACCYWKSSRRVAAALSGDSDLDLLVARDHQHAMQEVLLAHGFKPFGAVAVRAHPAITSFLGYDPSGGGLLHVHLHARLVLGAPLLKSWRVPWETALLARAAWHPHLPVRMLDPHDEAVLLLIRSCLEQARGDPVALRGRAAAREKFARDRAWLAPQLERATLRARAGELFPPALAALVSDAVLDRQGHGAPPSLRRAVRAALRDGRTCNAVEGQLRSLVHALAWAAGGFNARVLHAPRPWRRRAPGGGCVVAVMGVDGSGKSTAVAALRTWLAGEIDAVPIYFGTGGGRPSLLLLPLKLMVPLVAPLFATKPRGSSHGRVSDRAPGAAYGALLMLWAAVLAVEKRRKLVAARRGAERGLVVLADRYPQDQDALWNDGPLLGRLSWAPGWLRRFEARAYALARRLPPDLVIRLHVSPQTAARREPDMDPALIRTRIAAFGRLSFPGARVVSVDAEQPLAAVRDAVRRAVWDML